MRRSIDFTELVKSEELDSEVLASMYVTPEEFEQAIGRMFPEFEERDEDGPFVLQHLWHPQTIYGWVTSRQMGLELQLTT